MKKIFLLSISIAFLACNGRKNKKPEIGRIKYSSYSWSPVDSSESWEFQLHQYIEIDEKGNFIGLKQDNSPNEKKYFKGVLNDSLLTIIDSLLTSRLYDPIYKYTTDSGATYCGYDYCFDYNYHNTRHTIQFIPGYCPAEIQYLSSLLDSTIVKNENNKVPENDFSEYKKELSELVLKNALPFPKREKSNVEFQPEKLH